MVIIFSFCAVGHQLAQKVYFSVGSEDHHNQFKSEIVKHEQERLHSC